MLKKLFGYSVRWSYFLLLIAALLVNQRCRQTAGANVSDPLSVVTLSDRSQLILLDSIRAADAILVDTSDGLFERITPLDMQIQLKRNYPAGSSRERILTDYRRHLQEDVRNFTAEEAAFLRRVWARTAAVAQSISPDLLPPRVELIKMGANHYGPSAYYTREHRILIPANELESGYEFGMMQVMFHELFHIYSRRFPEQRRKLYSLIGFEDLGDPRDLITEPAFAERVLLNPDGVDYAQRIRLELGDSVIHAIPVLRANRPAFDPAERTFFNYLDFQLFPVDSTAAGWRVRSLPSGDSPLSLASAPDFFRQIKDNTQYIIHPDEVLADNFMILASAIANEDESLDRLSEPGRLLIEQIEEIISIGAQ